MLTFLTSAFHVFVLIENRVNAVIWVAMMRGLMDVMIDDSVDMIILLFLVTDF